MDNAKRKKRHVYRLSYAYEVGSSFDPDMEDVGQWENELHGAPYSRFLPRVKAHGIIHRDRVPLYLPCRIPP